MFCFSKELISSAMNIFLNTILCFNANSGNIQDSKEIITMKGIDIILSMYQGICQIGRCVHMKMNVHSAEG